MTTIADTHEDQVHELEEELAAKDKVVDSLTQTLLHLCLTLADSQKELKLRPYQAVYLQDSLSKMKQQRDEARNDAERLAQMASRVDLVTKEVVCNHCGGRAPEGLVLRHNKGCAYLQHVALVLGLDGDGGKW